VLSFKTVTAICLGATLCTAQTINISGVVQDSGGVGIVGATVKIEKANLSTTSGAGGLFTLTNNTLLVKPCIALDALAANAVQFRNGHIALTLTSNTPVGISFYDVGGRQMFNIKRTLGSGTHMIGVPMQTAGIFLCEVTIGHEAYSFKALSFGAFSMQQAAVSSGASLAKQAKAMAVISDVIAATKVGWLNYRCVINNSDTSGVVIKMISNAGDVTDADGNVYQSVRIGNQVWTVENLRTTKYNDGTAIPLITNPTAWSNLTTPAYCFYYNTTNADSINKKLVALYNWYVVSPTNPKKIAPAGWHVPSDVEWYTLQNYLIAEGYNWDGTTTGNKIAKALAAKTDWSSSGTAGAVGNNQVDNNRTGFSALPDGSFHAFDGIFSRLSFDGYWWSATEDDTTYAWCCYIFYYRENLNGPGNINKHHGFSVRLLRD
jgi:uncharacterized protein (TIGR02145 family)